jgi:hypothetical protein
VLVIANKCVFISGSGNCIGKAATKSRLPSSSESVRVKSTVPSNRKRLHRRSDDLALLPSLIPTFPRLSSRWNQGCHNVTRLYEEIVAQRYTGTQRTLQMRRASFSAESRTPRLQTDGHLGQTSFAQRRCAHDGEARTTPHERANGLSRATYPEQRTSRCRVQACAGLWPEARESARGRCAWSNGKTLSEPVGLRN